MEAIPRWALVTAVAPVAWGTTYYVTHSFLPAQHPLYGAAFRALPAGLLLLALARARPHGAWWWRSLLLGAVNMGGFFALVYLAAQLLPTSLASTIMATSPLAMMLTAWPLLAERPRPAHLLAALAGVCGVCLMLLTGTGAVSPAGVLASVCAMAISSCGYVLTKRWGAEEPRPEVLALTSWQLLAGGLLALPAAALVEGAPPQLDAPATLAFGYVTVVATALAFVAWFTGLRHLPAGTVGLLGLLNPVTGVLLGTLLAGDALTLRQYCGLALTLCSVLLAQPSTRRTPTRRGGRGGGDVGVSAAAATPASTPDRHADR